MDRRCFLLHGNAFPAAALSGGDWALPVDNLGLPNLFQDVARCVSGDFADSQFTAAWAKPFVVGGLALLGWTGRPGGKIRLTWRLRGDVVGPTPAWIDIRPRVARTRDLSFDDANFWTGRGDGPFIFIPPARLRADSLTVEFDGLGQGFEISYLFLSPVFRPDWPMAWGRKLEPASRVKTAKTIGGMVIAGPRLAPQRGMNLTFEELTKAEAMRWLNISMSHDVVEPLLFIPEPSDPRNFGREVFLASLAKLTGFDEVAPDRYRVALELEEIVA